MKNRHTRPEQDDVTYQVIGCAYDVHTELGTDHDEHVYREALHDFICQDTDYDCQKEVEIPIVVRGKRYGSRFADLVVDGELIIELKALTKANKSHYKQLGANVDHAGATRGLLFNFGTSSLDIWRYEPR